jgi:hypothetical protein
MDDGSPPRPTSTDLESSVLAKAGLGKDIVDHVSGIGATLVITRTHAVVIRDGAHFRPRNGVRAWPYGEVRDVQLSAPKHGNGRLVLRTGQYPWQAVSLFVDTQQWAAAERVAGQIRIRTSHARRIQTDAGPAAPDRDR